MMGTPGSSGASLWALAYDFCQMPWKLHFAKKWHLRLDFDELCYGCTDHIVWGSCRERSGKDMNSLGSRCGYSPWMWSCPSHPLEPWSPQLSNGPQELSLAVLL